MVVNWRVLSQVQYIPAPIFTFNVTGKLTDHKIGSVYFGW